MWLDGFPVPVHLIPPRFRELVSEVAVDDPAQHVAVVSRLEIDPYGNDQEDLLMQTAVVAADRLGDLDAIRRSSDFSVVSSSLSDADKFGEAADFAPSIGGHDYLVASWGSGSFFSYNLSEKVWMALGLSARTIGGDHQAIAFDDLTVPEMGIAGGEASSQYYWQSTRPVTWTIRNDYLRRYLWMRGAHGVRIFYYAKRLPPRPELLAAMGEADRFGKVAEDGRYELDLMVNDDHVYMQVWGVASVLAPELCDAPDAGTLIWPGHDGPMTRKRAGGLFAEPAMVFLDDRFLERYEQDALFDTNPIKVGANWHVSPRYGGQWSFSDCVRVGRNAVRIPLRKLYEGLPDREIVYAHGFVLGAGAAAAGIDDNRPHIAELTKRVVDALLDLGELISAFGPRIGIDIDAQAFTHLSRADIAANQWLHYPELQRLARVAPLDMTQSAFLSRCKSLSELIGRFPQKPLKAILRHCGCEPQQLENLRSLRMLQGFLTILEEVNARGDDWSGLAGAAADADWLAQNPGVAAIMLVNDLRNAEAHDNLQQIMAAIAALGYDTALLNQGYGGALDHVFSRCDGALRLICEQLRAVLAG